MRQERHKKDKPAIALVLCFCLVALVSVFTVKASVDKVKDNMQNAQTADVVKEKAVGTQDEDSENAEENIVDSRNTTNEDSENENSTPSAPAETPSEYIFPVEGDIITEHSTDTLIYWETLDQYMTHSGIDITSPAGTSVKACADGTVTRIEEDGKMGVTIEINHGDNIISRYCNLSQEGLIELGEIVAQGTVIGQIGHTSMFEFKSPDHLHLEFLNGDTSVNPLDYLK